MVRNQPPALIPTFHSTSFGGPSPTYSERCQVTGLQLSVRQVQVGYIFYLAVVIPLLPMTCAPYSHLVATCYLHTQVIHYLLFPNPGHFLFVHIGFFVHTEEHPRSNAGCSIWPFIVFM